MHAGQHILYKVASKAPHKQHHEVKLQLLLRGVVVEGLGLGKSSQHQQNGSEDTQQECLGVLLLIPA